MIMKEHFGPLNSSVLSSIEEYWGFGLPKDYRGFLLNFNGGIPDTSNACFLFTHQREGSVISNFYGLTKGSYNILKAYQDVGSRYPKNMLPVGDDVFGNRILLSVKGNDRGKVYFWDHEYEAEENTKPSYNNLTLIADSFKDFIKSLYFAGE